MDTRVEIPFGDGEYSFWLPLPQVVELERLSGRPMLAIEESLRQAIGTGPDGLSFLGGGSGHTKDVLDILRLGLIGGNCGMVDGEEQEVGPLRAKQLVEQYAYPARPLSENVVQAWRVVSAAIFGVELKKKAEPDPDANLSDTAKDS
ncbi:MAG: hypothetical protein ACK4ZW_08585 [Blastomonas sp.]